MKLMSTVTMMTMVTMETYLTAFDEVDTVVLYVKANKVTAKNALVVIRMNTDKCHRTILMVTMMT